MILQGVDRIQEMNQDAGMSKDWELCPSQS